MTDSTPRFSEEQATHATGAMAEALAELERMKGGGRMPPPQGGGQRSTVLPPPRGPEATPSPAPAPPPGQPEPSGPPSYFQGFDMDRQVFILQGEEVGYGEELQKSLMRVGLKLLYGKRAQQLDELAKSYGTSLEELTKELSEEAQRATDRSVPKVQEEEETSPISER